MMGATVISTQRPCTLSPVLVVQDQCLAGQDKGLAGQDKGWSPTRVATGAGLGTALPKQPRRGVAQREERTSNRHWGEYEPEVRTLASRLVHQAYKEVDAILQ